MKAVVLLALVAVIFCGESSSQFQSNALNQVNKYRTTHGVSKLNTLPDIAKIAQDWVTKMANNDNFA